MKASSSHSSASPRETSRRGREAARLARLERTRVGRATLIQSADLGAEKAPTHNELRAVARMRRGALALAGRSSSPADPIRSEQTTGKCGRTLSAAIVLGAGRRARAAGALTMATSAAPASSSKQPAATAAATNAPVRRGHCSVRSGGRSQTLVERASERAIRSRRQRRRRRTRASGRLNANAPKG